MDIYCFQNCQKIVVFSSDNKSVLLAKRKGENDYDGVYSFIGGKMEVTDKDIIEGIKREKNEEVGEGFRIKIYPIYNVLKYFEKKDGNKMILPHFYARYVKGEVNLNSEYSDIKWVSLTDLKSFEPKIPSVLDVVERLLKIIPLVDEKDLIEI